MEVISLPQKFTGEILEAVIGLRCLRFNTVSLLFHVMLIFSIFYLKREMYQFLFFLLVTLYKIFSLFIKKTNNNNKKINKNAHLFYLLSILFYMVLYATCILYN